MLDDSVVHSVLQMDWDFYVHLVVVALAEVHFLPNNDQTKLETNDFKIVLPKFQQWKTLNRTRIVIRTCD